MEEITFPDYNTGTMYTFKKGSWIDLLVKDEGNVFGTLKEIKEGSIIINAGITKNEEEIEFKNIIGCI